LLMQGHQGGVFNLGTGIGFSVREILETIARETGREIPYVIKPRRSGDPAYLVANADAARATLGVVPVHSNLATVIRSVWDWHQNAHQMRRAKSKTTAAD